jgi:diadenosine tetraphosphate (Ap4A) HIT family hydrolase
MCVFCKMKENTDQHIYSDPFVYAIYDHYPVTTGHALIITKRHIETYFDLDQNEKKSIDRAIMQIKSLIDLSYQPDGYNIGINNGKASGQTIFHLHIHMIPRYINDVLDPRGGVRGVIPSKQKY